MAENFPAVYFAKIKLFKVAELFIQCLEVNDEAKEILEKTFWEHASRGSSDTTWAEAWISVRLLHILQQRSNTLENQSDLEETFTSSRKEIFFNSLLEDLDLSNEACKELKVIFSKVLFSSLINKGKILPKLSSSTEAVLLNSLLDKPGETHMLLELISCDHKAFFKINKTLSNLYKSSVTYCLNSLKNSDLPPKKKLLNLLYSLLLLIKHDEELEEIGESLYKLCEMEVIDFVSILAILGCRQDTRLYDFIKDCENKRMLRQVDCSAVTDLDVIGSVYDKVTTSNGQINFEELCLRVLSLKCHWVEELVRMATQLVVSQEQDKLSAVVCFPALWPAIAVSLWKQLSNRHDILDIVLPAIESSQRIYPELFGQLYETVRRMKVVTDWLRSEGVTSLPDVNVMLSLTRNHSTLHVLQSTTHFVGLNHTNLLQLLLQLEGSKFSYLYLNAT